jgi:hypothetical protein
MSKNIDVSTRIDFRRSRGLMMGNGNISALRIRARRGLAPLEMVLVMPILMMLMAMLIVFGFASSWKMRTETVARDVAWRARWHRFANNGVLAPEWPANAGMAVSTGRPLQVFGGDPVVHDPVVAGPLGVLPVNDYVLDFSRSVLNGIADIDRAPSVFPTLTRFDFSVNHEVLDDRFQNWQMGISNYARRVPMIYETGLEQILDAADYRAALEALRKWRRTPISAVQN